MMKKLHEEVIELKDKEYGRAAAKFGLKNNSDHESYAVLLEEVQEAQEDMEIIHRKLNNFWLLTRHNEKPELKLGMIKALERYAELLACEAIQVAAMAKKAAITIVDPMATQEMEEIADEVCGH